MKPIICFIVSAPITAKSFLDNHFSVLSDKFDIILVANLNDNSLPVYSNKYLFKIKHIPIKRKINLFHDIKALILLILFLKSEKISTVITFTPKASLLGIFASFFSGIKKRILFFTGQVWHTKNWYVKPFFILIDKMVVFFSTDTIVDGYSQRNFLIKNNIINDENSIVIGKGTISGVDINQFKPNPSLRLKLRNAFNFSNNDIVFLFLGRLNKDKGIYDLLNAFILLDDPNVKLLIVGQDEENIIEAAEKKFMNKNISFIGPTITPFDIMQVCDVFCLPSHREAFGLSIIEASSCAKAIICSDTYGLEKTVIDNVTGLKHITNDILSLTNKMKLLIKDNELRIKLGENGRKYVVENFSSDLMTKLWLEYFTKLLLTH
jgi:glycosyltransferase involved in cell wall biosynthesis